MDFPFTNLISNNFIKTKTKCNAFHFEWFWIKTTGDASCPTNVIQFWEGKNSFLLNIFIYLDTILWYIIFSLSPALHQVCLVRRDKTNNWRVQKTWRCGLWDKCDGRTRNMWGCEGGGAWVSEEMILRVSSHQKHCLRWWKIYIFLYLDSSLGSLLIHYSGMQLPDLEI